MTQYILIEDLEISNIDNAAALYIDTRTPKHITLSSSAWSNNPQCNYLRIKKERLLDLIKNLSLKIVDFQQTNPIVKNNGVWAKYIKFFRISRDEFTALDRNDEAIFGISDLEIDFKNYTV